MLHRQQDTVEYARLTLDTIISNNSVGVSLYNVGKAGNWDELDPITLN